MADQRTIVLVEDEEKLRKALAAKLSREGYSVVDAADGEEGLARIQESKPDCVILDILMPKMNGIEVLRQVRNDPELKDIPILLLTNSPDQTHISEGMVSGAVAYLVKSNYSLSDIVDKVKSLIH